MRLFSIIHKLSLSLLAASLTTAAPVHNDHLTAATFKDTIANGVWLVEHYSPYCHHCREFAPTWEKLVQQTEKSHDPGIHLAQVNCAVDGDLCDENKIRGYPTINLYRDGEYVESYRGSRDLDLLTEYISKHAEPAGASPATTAATTPPVEEIAKPTPAVAPLHLQTARAAANPSGSVLSLTSENFQDIVDQGPVFIKFFAPWCGHCKKLAPKWKELAQQMQHKLNIAEVDCDANPLVCKEQDIQGYPMLMFYAHGTSSEYTGGRNTGQLKAYAEKASAPAVQELVVEDLESHILSNPVVYLLLHSANESRILNQVTQAANILLGAPPVFTSSSPILFTRYYIPQTTSWALLSFSEGDPSAPAFTYPPTPSGSPGNTAAPAPADLKRWLLTHRIPIALELTQESFQVVMNAPHAPLVVIAAVDSSNKAQVEQKFLGVAKKWKERAGGNGVVFTWMDGERWAKWMKSMYGIAPVKGQDPQIVVADHQHLNYYNTNAQGDPIKLHSANLFEAIEDIRNNLVKIRHSQNIFERGINYLNRKLDTLQKFATEHTFYFIFCIVLFLFLMFQVLKRMLVDSSDYEYRHPHGKPTRLD